MHGGRVTSATSATNVASVASVVSAASVVRAGGREARPPRDHGSGRRRRRGRGPGQRTVPMTRALLDQGNPPYPWH